MTPEEKAELWLTIFGVTPNISARTGVPEAHGLAGVTAEPKWDTFNTVPTGKPLGLQQWKDAFALALHLDEAVPGIVAPVPGADPEGFIWLTWRTKDDRALALELRADLTKSAYRWTMTVDGEKRTYETTNANMRPLWECFRTTFGDTKAQRNARRPLDEAAYS
jgi:hypothetical protein